MIRFFHGVRRPPHLPGPSPCGGCEIRTREGLPPTRFPIMLTSVHHRPPPFATCANTPTVNADERSRTGVNEPRTEPTPCRAAWIVGPLIALALPGAGLSTDTVWRVLLGLSAPPAAAVIYLRTRMPESPRYQVQVQGNTKQAVSRMAAFTGGQVSANGSGRARQQMGLQAFPTNRHWLIILAGTAGTWFLHDYAYYGNTISTPQILSLISPTASAMAKIALQLAIFVVAAVPGYLLAIARLDKIGHRRLQLVGFTMMGACFLVITAVPGMTTAVVPFLLVNGVSYFFTEFGPNMTTFVMPSERDLVTIRATDHGISAGVGKLGAFIGVLFPILSDSLGLRGILLLTAEVAVLGFALTLVLPEPAGRSLEDMPTNTPARSPRQPSQHRSTEDPASAA